MPQTRREMDQSTEYLRSVYRSLGLSEETLERAIQYSSGEPMAEEPRGKPCPGRPELNAGPCGPAETRRQCGKSGGV
jgi:hypothetical protein